MFFSDYHICRYAYTNKYNRYIYNNNIKDIKVVNHISSHAMHN